MIINHVQNQVTFIMLTVFRFVVLFCLYLGAVTTSSPYSGNCDNPTDSCTIGPWVTTNPYSSSLGYIPSLTIITPFCNEINVSISVVESLLSVVYYIAPFVLGNTNLNNLQPEYNIYNGSCSGHCDNYINIGTPSYYVITISPNMCFICNPHSTNSCCPVSFAFNITYGLYPANNY